MKKLAALALAGTLSCVMLTGCNGLNGSFGTSSFLYDDADKYTMGNATLEDDGIEAIDIAWVSGEVTVNYHAENTITISETANKNLDEETTMYYWVDGDTLRVKFVKSGKWDISNLEKDLTVWLPENLVLEELIVDTVSADVFVDDIVATKAVFDTVSGDVELNHTSFSQSMEVDTTSGKLNATLTGKLQDMEIDTVSGMMVVEAEEVKNLDADSTSGEIRLTALVAPDSVNADTVSGDIILTLPKDAGFTASFDSVSGSFKSELEMKKDGKKYVYGDGSKKYEFDTTSGDVKIEEMK